MFSLDGIQHNKGVEEIVDVLCNKTQTQDRSFFRTEVAYFFSKLASNMRVTIKTKDRGVIPVNMYAVALASSGFGKGHSMYIMENEFIAGFKKRFSEETMPVIADQNLWKIANNKAVKQGTDPQEEYDKVCTEYKKTGAYPFTFDSGTVPAVKQLRHKLLLANSGAISLQIDEIGSNLIGSTEVLNAFLELYDQGSIKQKLTKNTAENTRTEDIDGKTPTNMLLFGTPSKLFDGSSTEDQFYTFLDIGYARRCIFGIGQTDKKAFHSMTAQEIYLHTINSNNNNVITKWSNLFTKLADPSLFGWVLDVEDDVAIRLLEYKIACEKEADTLADHEDIKKTELSHRYFKALKLAGSFAFIDESMNVTMSNLMEAILLVEESGKAFQTILNREKTYVKLANYIAAVNNELTHADLHEALPFYKTGTTARNEMMLLAMAWGYKKHIVIRKNVIEGIEFFRGETLKETDLTKVKLAYSDHWAYNYQKEIIPFNRLHELTQAPDFNWTNHHFKGEHRCEENVIQGFNLLVIDVDGGGQLSLARELLKSYTYLIYTTKRHTESENRFRIILPTNYELSMDADDYKEFMLNVTKWLPFTIDEGANQRSRKWLTYDKGEYFYNLDGQLLDVLPFIPKTSKNEHYDKQFNNIDNLDNLERWFLRTIPTQGRNNQLLKYALALVDSGCSLLDVSQKTHSLNSKLPEPLPKTEIDNTILVTVAKKYQKA